MSRIGKQPVNLPSGTTLNIGEESLEVKGSKGTLLVPVFSNVQIATEGEVVTVSAMDETGRAMQGLTRTLLQNAVTGVTTGWERSLELHGVGMRAAVSGNGILLSLGFSHQIQFPAPEGVTFQVTKNVITIAGIDKQLVGETAAQIRKLRKPEPYKGKGIRYTNEVVRRKAGKTGKATK